MAKHSNDIVQAIVDAVDEVTLDAIIQEYLETPDNGYTLKEYVTTTIENGETANLTTTEFWDGFNWIVTPYIYPTEVDVASDSTAIQITVEEWKDQYLEEYNNEAIRTMKGIVTTDYDGNILVGKDYRILVDDQFDTYINYPIDSTVTLELDTIVEDGITYIDAPIGVTNIPFEFWKWIQYEYPGQRSFKGSSISIANNTLFLYWFVAYSDNGENWSYIYQDKDTGEPTETDNFNFPTTWYFTLSEIDQHSTIIYPRVRKARYVRIYFSGISATTVLTNPNEYTYYYTNEVDISNITHQEVVEGKGIRDESTPSNRLEDLTIASQVSDTVNESGSLNDTDWTTIASSVTSVPVACLFNEEARITSDGAGTLYGRIFDGTNTIDEGSIASAGSFMLFNRNTQLQAYENVTRYIQLKSSGASIAYSIKYQNTRHGF
jgi:hypothetical protein